MTRRSGYRIRRALHSSSPSSACNRSSKPDPQAALDDAFKAGLLNPKDEYDAKRARYIMRQRPLPPLAQKPLPQAQTRRRRWRVQ